MSETRRTIGRGVRGVLSTTGLLLLGWALPWSAALAQPAWQGQTTGTVDATSITLATPTGTVQNDLLLATISTRGGAVSAPAGWTLVAQQTQGTETLAVYYQRFNATTATNHQFSWGTRERAAGAILRYTGVDLIQAVDISGIAVGNSTNATAPSATTTVANTRVVRVAGVGVNNAPTAPASTTQRVSIVGGGGGPDAGLGVADAIQAAAGATGTAAFSSTNANWVAVTLALRPFIDTLCASSPGSGTTTVTGGIVNTYYPGTATASAGAVSVSVGTSRGAATPIAAGDLLLVIQMQDAAINTLNDDRYGDGIGTGTLTGNGSGATDYNNTGLYEFVVAKGAVGGGAVPVEGKGTGGGLINTYTNADATTTQGQRRFQVVRVPQYFDASVTGTVTASAWDGTSGGIVAIDVAGTLTFSGGGISVNALGFRGGAGQGLGGATGGANTDYRTLATTATNGNKGEGVAGSPNFIYDGTGTLATGGGYPDGAAANASRARGAPGNAGGGGTDGRPSGNDENSGGGGGGNGGAGGVGGNSWNSNLPRGGFGGAVFPHAAARLAMGGGGGSGSRNNSTGVQSSGGLGGGIIIVRANSVSGTGTLSANGGWPTTDNYTPANDGGGGGGAGGSVLVFARTGGLTGLTVNAQGAVGANAWPAQAPGTFPGERHGPGGGGAGGVVYLSSAAGATNVSGAANGTTTTAAEAYGATPGAAGAVNTDTESQIPGAGTGGTCKATLACVAGFGATAEAERVLVRWETACEIGTAGFHVELLDPVSGGYERVNQTVLPALLTAPRGGHYSLVDPGATPGKTRTYRLVEQEVWGGQRIHGPYTVTPGERTEGFTRAAIAQGLRASDEDQGYDDPARGYRAMPRPLDENVVTRKAPTGLSSAGAEASSRRAAAQIRVRQDGLLHVSAGQLAQALGATEASVRAWLRTGALELTSAGEPVAWLPDTPAQGATDPSGLLFYGEAIDSLFSRDNVYRVRASLKGTAMDPSGGTVPPLAAAGSFTERVTVEQDRFAGTVVATDPNSDYWYWEAFIGGSDLAWSTRRFTVSLPHAAGEGTIKVFLKGAAVGVHVVRVSVNGRPLGEASWQDLQDFELRLPVTAAQIQSGDNSVEVRALGGDGDIFYLDRIETEYRRTARAVDNRLTLTAESDGPLAVDGFGASDIRVFDIGDPKRPVVVTATSVGPGTVGQSVSFNAQQGRRYLALAGVAIASAALEPMTATDLQYSRDRVDYLVIAAPELRDAAQALADYRESRGLASRVVRTDEIYDSFSWGKATPEALRDFLRYATRSWGVRFVVLAGPGTFDYRDLGNRQEPQVPTLMTSTPSGLFACDSCLVDFDGDGAPDLPISRIPASTAADIQVVLGKVSAYEKSAAPLRQARLLFLADRSDPAAGSFSSDSDAVARLLPPGTTVTRGYLDESPVDGVRAALFEGMNESAGWVNYIGHGGIDRFGGSEALLTVNDLGALRKADGPLPVVSALTCAVNRFEVPAFAPLGERLLLHDGGGAVAIWAATSLSLNDPGVRLGRDLFSAAFKLQARTLGEAVQQSLRENTGRRDVPAYLLRTYALLGDAAMQLSW